MVIGRGEELARIEQLLATARLGTSQVLVIAGEPGIGKTALLEYAVEHAREMTVLRRAGSSPSPRSRSPACTRCCGPRWTGSASCPSRRPRP